MFTGWQHLNNCPVLWYIYLLRETALYAGLLYIYIYKYISSPPHLHFYYLILLFFIFNCLALKVSIECFNFIFILNIRNPPPLLCAGKYRSVTHL